MKIIQKLLSLSLLMLIISYGKTTKQAENFSSNSIELNNNKGTEKLNAIIDAFNSFSTKSYDSYDKYVATFGNNPIKISFIKDWFNVTKVTATLEKAATIDTCKTLNPLISNYIQTATSLEKILNQSYTYYDMKDYESDNFAKSKEFHESTLNAYNHFFDVDYLLRNKSKRRNLKLFNWYGIKYRYKSC